MPCSDKTRSNSKSPPVIALSARDLAARHGNHAAPTFLQVRAPLYFSSILYDVASRGVVGRGRGGGRRPPTFFDRGMAVPHSRHFFGLKFVQKLVHCCNWLLTETQCKIISVQQIDLSVSICYRHSNTSSCIAGKDQRSAVAIFLTCMSVRVCRPKLFKNLCLSLVSGVCPLLF